MKFTGLFVQNNALNINSQRNLINTTAINTIKPQFVWLVRSLDCIFAIHAITRLVLNAATPIWDLKFELSEWKAVPYPEWCRNTCNLILSKMIMILGCMYEKIVFIVLESWWELLGQENRHWQKRTWHSNISAKSILTAYF